MTMFIQWFGKTSREIGFFFHSLFIVCASLVDTFVQCHALCICQMNMELNIHIQYSIPELWKKVRCKRHASQSLRFVFFFECEHRFNYEARILQKCAVFVRCWSTSVLIMYSACFMGLWALCVASIFIHRVVPNLVFFFGARYALAWSEFMWHGEWEHARCICYKNAQRHSSHVWIWQYFHINFAFQLWENRKGVEIYIAPSFSSHTRYNSKMRQSNENMKIVQMLVADVV